MKHRLTAGMAITFILVVSGILVGTVILSSDTSEDKGSARDDREMSTVIQSEMTNEYRITGMIVGKKSGTTAIDGEAVVTNSATKKTKNQSNTVDNQKTTAEAKPPKEITDDRRNTASEQTTEEKRVPTTETEKPTTVDTVTEGTQTPTTESHDSKTTETKPETESSPSTEARTDPTTEAGTDPTTEKEKKWHPAVTKKVWVVDEEAWDETITYTDYETHDVCSACGAYIDGGPEVLENHVNQSIQWAEEHGIPLEQACLGAFRTISVPIEKTEVVHHEEEGHWEKVVVKEGYWE